MKIVIHDYAGHPFQTQLSRALANMGHDVIHIYFSGDEGPKGDFSNKPSDPISLSFIGVGIDVDYSKTNFFKRRAGDVKYGKRVAKLLRDKKPDVVLSGNTPTEAQKYIQGATKKAGGAFVYWIQDFYSIAAMNILKDKLPFLGKYIGMYYMYLERQQLRQSDHVVAITDGFIDTLLAWGVDKEDIEVINNWGAIDDIPLLNRPTNWQIAQGYRDKKLAIYSGTLALKHDPKLLLELARKYPELTVLVVASGVGVESLKKLKNKYSVENLEFMPLQPFGVLPEILGAASILVAVIEEDAGEYSVPSKVLSYLCAGRPILLSAPRKNLASEIIVSSNSGLVSEPGDLNSFVDNAGLLISACGGDDYGLNARKYAENKFNIESITAKFENIFKKIRG